MYIDIINMNADITKQNEHIFTLSNDSNGLEDFKQFPVIFSSDIVCTERKEKHFILKTCYNYVT